MTHSTWIYILIMAAVTFVIRALPMTLMRRFIEHPFLRSFLYYVPYVTLAVMTFPAIIECTASPLAGAAALVIGIVLALLGVKLVGVAALCCVTVFIIETVVF